MGNIFFTVVSLEAVDGALVIGLDWEMIFGSKLSTQMF